MSDLSATTDRVRPHLLQFSLKAMLVVMTGTSVIFSLGSFAIEAGVLIGVPLVGVWWIVLAIRAKHRRVTYHLASVLLAELVAFLVSLPFISIPTASLDEFDVLLSGTIAIFLCVTVLRRRIRRPGVRALVTAGIACSYLATAAWFLLAVLIVAIQAETNPLDDLLENVVGALVFTFLFVTLALPFMASFAVCICAVLRAINPLGSDLPHEQRAVFEAVAQLRWEERPPVLEEILARTGLSPERAEEVLEQLVKKRVLRRPRRSGRSEVKGYRLR